MDPLEDVDEWMRLGLAALISKLVEVVPLDRILVLVGIASRAIYAMKRSTVSIGLLPTLKQKSWDFPSFRSFQNP